MKSWQKYLNVEVILISEFVISEMRINSTFGLFDRLRGSHFENPLIVAQII